MNIPGYDQWKLASPDDDGRGLCKDCDRDELERIGEDQALEFLQRYKHLTNHIYQLSENMELLRQDGYTKQLAEFEKAIESMLIAVDEIAEQVTDKIKDQVLSEAGMCRQCYDDDHADDRD